MRVALVGDFADRYDEGLKNIGKYTAQAIARSHEVYLADLSRVFTPGFWKDVKAHKPDVIHYLFGNTLRGILLARLLRERTGAPAIVSINHPGTSQTLRNGTPSSADPFLRRARPDLALVQSESMERLARRVGWDFAHLGNAVDTVKFKPTTVQRRKEVREKYGLSQSDKVVLHVGHLTPQRNLRALAPFVASGYKVLVIASEYQGVRAKEHKALIDLGFQIEVGYVERLDEVYGSCDVYAFPVRRHDTILMPLSVMEAMACNVPVIAVPHDGLTHFFQEGEGLAYAAPEDFQAAAERVMATPTKTRRKVEGHSWERVARDLSGHYESVLRK